MDDNVTVNNSTEGTPPLQPVVAEYVKEYSGTVSSSVDNNSATNSNSSNNNILESIETVKIKEEPPSVDHEVVLIDSEDEKEESK